jgi:hypothetical protein
MNLRLRYLFFTAFLLIVLGASGYAQVNVALTRVHAYDGYIRVEWSVKSEDDVDHYEIWRSAGSQSLFAVVGTAQRGVFYFDDRADLSKTEDQVFSYIVRAVNASGTMIAQSGKMPVSYGNASSTAKRTWGSIKAMFR